MPPPFDPLDLSADVEYFNRQIIDLSFVRSSLDQSTTLRVARNSGMRRNFELAYGTTLAPPRTEAENNRLTSLARPTVDEGTATEDHLRQMSPATAEDIVNNMAEGLRRLTERVNLSPPPEPLIVPPGPRNTPSISRGARTEPISGFVNVWAPLQVSRIAPTSPYPIGRIESVPQPQTVVPMFPPPIFGTVIPARTELTVLGADDVNQRPLGFTVLENVGIGIVNTRAVSGVSARRVTMPEFEIASNPQIQMGDIRQRRFNLIDRQLPDSRSTLQPVDYSKLSLAELLALNVPLFRKLSSWQRLMNDEPFVGLPDLPEKTVPLSQADHRISSWARLSYYEEPFFVAPPKPESKTAEMQSPMQRLVTQMTRDIQEEEDRRIFAVLDEIAVQGFDPQKDAAPQKGKRGKSKPLTAWERLNRDEQIEQHQPTRQEQRADMVINRSKAVGTWLLIEEPEY